jgi:hypothetical protein
MTQQLIKLPTKLETGDFFPFLKISLSNGLDVDLMHFVSTLPICLVGIRKLDNLISYLAVLDRLSVKSHLIIYCLENSTTNQFRNFRITKSNDLLNLLECLDQPILYVLNANRRIIEITNLQLGQPVLTLPIDQVTNIPYLLIENVLSEELLAKVIAFYHSNKNQAVVHNTPNKHRLHVFANPGLEMEIDNKLSRSVFPEIKKIFNFDVKYRENYKLCSYDSETNGRFSAHRDTVHPFGARKLAMTLCLNENFTGGEFRLNEYGFSIKLKKNSALIFPGICSHEVSPITSGSRMVIVTFFTTKELPAYKVKSNYFDDKELTYSQVNPT